MKNNYLFLVTFYLLLMNSCQEGTINLAKDGHSNYQIVVTAEKEEIKRAAQTLKNYLNKIAGVELPLVKSDALNSEKASIWVGINPEGIGDEDGIAIRTKGKDLYLEGGGEKSMTFAVTEFLEQFLKCRWYAPDEEVIPSQKQISLPSIDFKYVPDIKTRTVSSRLFFKNETFAEQHKVTTESFPYYVPKARVHTFHRFLPEEKFYKDHPEYYALRESGRLPTQLCLTNEKVLEIVIDSVAAWFEEFPEAEVLSVSQDDNQQYCLCDACRKIDEEEGSPSGTMIRFVNKVAAAFPEKTISTLAYQYTRKPSKTKPADNVLITLCSIECDRSQPISENCTDFAEDLIGWGKLTQNIRIWDYTTQFTNFLAPFPNILTLKPNVQLFRDNNAKWIFEQHSNNPSELFELRSYLLAKLLWNPDLKVDSLILDFTNGYYEEAGPFVKQYIDRIHAELQKEEDFFLFLYGDPSEAFDAYLSPALLEQYTQWFDEAELSVAQKPTILNRVKKARLGIDYAVLEACRKNIANEYRLILSDATGKKTINPLVKERLEAFYKTCQKNEITLMNEMRFSVQEYYDNYKAALAVAQKPNKALGKKVTTLTKPKKYAKEDPMVLTDGALGGSSFYANWLGYEGNNLEVVLDLGTVMETRTISMAYLQVTNHIVFFPARVDYLGSEDGENYFKLGTVVNQRPLTKSSQVNDIQYFDLEYPSRKTRFIKVMAINVETPYWHHAAGLPSWVFADEIIVE